MNLLGDKTEVFTDFSFRQEDVDSPVTDIEHGRRSLALSGKGRVSLSFSTLAQFMANRCYIIEEKRGMIEIRPSEHYNIIKISDYNVPSNLISWENPNPPLRTSTTSDILEQSESDISSQIAEIFDEAEPEEFEDGMQNLFVERLLDKVREYGDYAIVEICHIILNEKSNPECAAEALKWLGNMDHNTTYKYRQWLLTTALNKCKSSIVRDGANLGLAFMDDPATIPYLEKAISSEESSLLRKLMKLTLEQLEKTRTCLSTLE